VVPWACNTGQAGDDGESEGAYGSLYKVHFCLNLKNKSFIFNDYV
jgi:hypothetical protein